MKNKLIQIGCFIILITICLGLAIFNFTYFIYNLNMSIPEIEFCQNIWWIVYFILLDIYFIIIFNNEYVNMKK